MWLGLFPTQFPHVRNDGLGHWFLLFVFDEQDVENWYVERFFALRQTVFQNPESFFNNFAALSDDEAEAMARGIWKEINGKNLRENIAPTRSRASLVMQKGADHRVTEVHLRKL